MTDLYEKEWENSDVSGYGYEMTFKLKKACCEDEEGELRCVCGILQHIARITFENGEVFAPFEYLASGQTQGIDVNSRSKITGFICVPDPSLRALRTPNGSVTFLEFIGVTDEELKTLDSHESVYELYLRLGSDVTDYRRKSVA